VAFIPIISYKEVDDQVQDDNVYISTRNYLLAKE